MLGDRFVRPGAFVVAAAVHAAVLVGVGLPQPSLAGSDDGIQIAVTQSGDASAEDMQAPNDEEIAQQAAQAAQKPEEKKEEQKKERPEVVAAEAPKREVEESEAIARRVEEVKEMQLQEKQDRDKQQAVASDAAEAQEEHSARRGVAEGAQRSGVSRAAYAARVLSEIRRRQLHPARSGVVRVAFSIGEGGGVSASVAESSGDGGLDSMALRILRACHPGPPPGGHFAGTVAIRFH